MSLSTYNQLQKYLNDSKQKFKQFNQSLKQNIIKTAKTKQPYFTQKKAIMSQKQKIISFDQRKNSEFDLKLNKNNQNSIFSRKYNSKQNSMINNSKELSQVSQILSNSKDIINKLTDYQNVSVISKNDAQISTVRKSSVFSKNQININKQKQQPNQQKYKENRTNSLCFCANANSYLNQAIKGKNVSNKDLQNMNVQNQQQVLNGKEGVYSLVRQLQYAKTSKIKQQQQELSNNYRNAKSKLNNVNVVKSAVEQRVLSHKGSLPNYYQEAQKQSQQQQKIQQQSNFKQMQMNYIERQEIHQKLQEKQFQEFLNQYFNQNLIKAEKIQKDQQKNNENKQIFNQQQNKQNLVPDRNLDIRTKSIPIGFLIDNQQKKFQNNQQTQLAAAISNAMHKKNNLLNENKENIELQQKTKNFLKMKEEITKKFEVLSEKLQNQKNQISEQQNEKQVQAKNQLQHNNQNQSNVQNISQLKNQFSASSSIVNIQCFNICYVIGKGGFGKVWKVQMKQNQQFFALKEMSKAKSINSVLNERTLLSQLKHNFLINMQFAFQDYDNLYLIMDLLSGGDLRYHIGRQHKFSEKQTKFFVSNIIIGLEYLHENTVIHRDIKPENLVLDSKGYVRITDLGIARMIKQENFNDTSGTPGYMAPEVMCRQNHGFEVDFFALGVICYEFMLGRRPYIGRSRKEIRDAILEKQVLIKQQEIPLGWSIESADFINKMIQRKPINRLGANGIFEIKNHPWLKDVDWVNLELKNVVSPFIPSSIEDNYDLQQQLSLNTTDEDLLQQNAELLKRKTVQDLFDGYALDKQNNIAAKYYQNEQQIQQQTKIKNEQVIKKSTLIKNLQQMSQYQ